MNLKDLQRNWDTFGKIDPYWSVLTKEGMKGNKWDKDDFYRTGERTVNKVLSEIKTVFPDLRFQKALDFGCGAGRMTQALACRFQQVAGVDIASSMIDLARQNNSYPKNCQYFLNKKNDLTLFGEEEFDLILTFITLQHMEPLYAKQYILEFLRILKPEGIIVFQIPAQPDIGTWLYHSSLGTMLRKMGAFFKKPEQAVMEMYWVSQKEIENLINEHGGSLLKVKKNHLAGKSWKSYTYFVKK